MNEILYDDLIAPWISYKYRPILRKKDLWLYGYKRLLYDENFLVLLADICIHGGMCDKRYCICKYFDAKDKIDCYERIYKIHS
jgi:hypothetical protein